jgi:hypothetical protein
VIDGAFVASQTDAAVGLGHLLEPLAPALVAAVALCWRTPFSRLADRLSRRWSGSGQDLNRGAVAPATSSRRSTSTAMRDQFPLGVGTRRCR